MRSLLLVISVYAAAMLGGCAGGPPPLVLTDAEKSSSATLIAGDPAPPLQVSQWVRGGPVTEFKPGMVYVVDFWATWCGPCLASMPRLSRLQDSTQGRVVVIGMTTGDSENTLGDVRSLLRKYPDLARFTIAFDHDDTTARRYRAAARETAIPRSFIIDQQGRIAWCGHPAKAEPVLNAVLDGSWDLAAARREAVRRDQARVASQRVVREYLAACDRRDEAAQLACTEQAIQIPIDDMTAMCPSYWAWTARVSLLASLKRNDEARAAAAEAAAKREIRDDHQAMAEVAQVVKPVSLEDAGGYAARALQLAEELESRPPADEWEKFLADGEVRRIAWTRIIAADIAAAQGRHADAAALLRRAIPVWPDGSRFIPSKADLKRRLAAYEASAKRGS